MLFTTPPFFLFLALTLAAFYLAPRRFRSFILLVASYFFYAAWNVNFVLLLAGLTVTDYWAAHLIAREQSFVLRRRYLRLGVGVNLLFLCIFKYAYFVASNVTSLLGLPEPQLFAGIILPLGISFHTFQSISYLVDVYRREQDVISSPMQYALYISFFPQLVAGPIVRAHDFFRDLAAWRPPCQDEILRGVLLIALGLTKKIVLADRFAQVADVYYQNVAAHPGSLPAWGATVSFAIQIYFDFSGYTDIAIGTALLFGFHFPENFKRPYLAASVTDFWRRWHISLSSWLRDYVYIPLGGNRHGVLRTYRNLLLTMLLGGIWHGANWTFVVWGAYQGILLSAERPLNRVTSGVFGRLLYPFRVMVTFALVVIGWVFFRASTVAEAILVIGNMFGGAAGEFLAPAWLAVTALLCLLLSILEERYEWFDQIVRGPVDVYSAALALLLLSIELLAAVETYKPFIYFQF